MKGYDVWDLFQNSTAAEEGGRDVRGWNRVSPKKSLLFGTGVWADGGGLTPLLCLFCMCPKFPIIQKPKPSPLLLPHDALCSRPGELLFSGWAVFLPLLSQPFFQLCLPLLLPKQPWWQSVRCPLTPVLLRLCSFLPSRVGVCTAPLAPGPGASKGLGFAICNSQGLEGRTLGNCSVQECLSPALIF